MERTSTVIVRSLERGSRRHDQALSGLQCISHFFNFILLVVGSGAAALGFWVYYSMRADEDKSSSLEVVGLIYLAANLCTIAEGCFIVLVVFIGVIAICTVHRCTLIWYFSLVMVGCVASLMFTVMTFIVFFQLQSTINSSLSDYVQNEYGLYGKEETTQLLDNVQKSFQCCGSKSYQDWYTSEWYKLQRLGHFNPSDAPVHPETCCVLTAEETPTNVTRCAHINQEYPNQYMYRAPCGEEIYVWLRWPTLYLAFAGVALFLASVCEITTVSALLRTLGPLRKPPKPKPIEKHLLTHVHSESEDSSFTSSRERPKKLKKYHKSNTQSLDRQMAQQIVKGSPKTQSLDRQRKIAKGFLFKDVNGSPSSNGSDGVYVNSAFRHEAEEQATPL